MIALALASVSYEVSGLAGNRNDRRVATFGGLVLTPCQDQQPMEIAVLARLAPGQTIAGVRSEGFDVAPAVENGADDSLLVVQSPLSATTVDNLRKSPSVFTAGILLAQTMDKELRSCDYRLADNPQAKRIADLVTNAMIADGLLSPYQVNAPGTTFLLTDDPTDPGKIIFTVLLATPLERPSPDMTISELLTPYAAVLDKASSTIETMGKAQWYGR
jgi:hypothetical protein